MAVDVFGEIAWKELGVATGAACLPAWRWAQMKIPIARNVLQQQ